jgi:hypothetical protein
MSQKNAVRYRANCQITAETTVALASSVPSQKQKEEAKQTLYLNRV